MNRLSLAAVVLVACGVVGLAAQEKQDKKFGTALTLSEVTKVSEIYANPAKYDGKRVQVEGPIVDVCEEMGCWLALGSDQESQTIRFKVEDGVIVFPMSVRGMKAKVEGIVSASGGAVMIKGEGAIVTQAGD
jgi:hypothetical protein